MSGLETLATCAGAWRGTSRLHDPHTNSPEDSASNLTVTPILRGLFLRVDYTWAYQGAPQEGTMLIGYEPKAERAQAVTAFWADTWHMGRAVLVSRGSSTPAPPEADGSLNLLGSYPAPTGPDWGWRTMIQPAAEGEDGALQISMYNITPDGQEYIAVEATYTREPAD
jgi:hypothetical protein